MKKLEKNEISLEEFKTLALEARSIKIKEDFKEVEMHDEYKSKIGVLGIKFITDKETIEIIYADEDKYADSMFRNYKDLRYLILKTESKMNALSNFLRKKTVCEFNLAQILE